MNFYLGHLRYSYYSTDQNYGGQKKKFFSLWEDVLKYLWFSITEKYWTFSPNF